MFDTTYKSEKNDEAIRNLLGYPFGFWQKMKLKGIGSRRMILVKTSPRFEKYKNRVSDINYLNVELRPKGILIHLGKGLKNFSWAIPYFQLSLFKTHVFSFHGQGEFLSVACDKNFFGNKYFFEKMEQLRNDFLRGSVPNIKNTSIHSIQTAHGNNRTSS